jgi:hypothetical protein
MPTGIKKRNGEDYANHPARCLTAYRAQRYLFWTFVINEAYHLLKTLKTTRSNLRRIQNEVFIIR